MKYRLSNSHLLTFVGLAENMLSHVPIVHTLGRSFAFSFVVPFVRKKLGLAPQFKLLLRNSVTDPSFRLLRSDIDLTLVIPDSTDNKTISKILKRYRSLHRWFLPLGEIEVYTTSEFKTRTELETVYRPLFQTIRLLRKLRLQTDLLKTPLPLYHLRKTELSIAKIRREITGNEKASNDDLGKSIEKVLVESSTAFVKGNSVPEVRGQSPFLGWSLSSTKSDDPDTISLSPKICFALASMLPDADWGFASWMEQINDYRKFDDVNKRLLAISKYEVALVRCVARMNGETPEARDWLGRLGRLIEKYDAQKQP